MLTLTPSLRMLLALCSLHPASSLGEDLLLISIHIIRSHLHQVGPSCRCRDCLVGLNLYALAAMSRSQLHCTPVSVILTAEICSEGQSSCMGVMISMGSEASQLRL